MKHFIRKAAAAVLLVAAATASCAAQERIALPKPAKSLKTSLIKALDNRSSQREYSPRQITNQDLATLLWAANGINRPDGRRTAPSAINAQDVDIYVVRADGAYRWDAKDNALNRVSTKDLRPLVARGQDFVLGAPVSLVLVSDDSNLGGKPSPMQMADAAYVSQNICLYCSAAGMACCPRATMDKDALKKELQLTDHQEAFLNNIVGYKK